LAFTPRMDRTVISPNPPHRTPNRPLVALSELNLLRATRVRDIMRPDVVVVRLDTDLEELKHRFTASHAPIFVLDDGRLYGTIAFEDLADAAFDPNLKEPVAARDLARRLPVALLPWEDLERALGIAESTQEEHLPVVDRRDGGRIIGVVQRADLIQAYNRALLRARAVERGERPE
jgi:chloride channel protein, CIC family